LIFVDKIPLSTHQEPALWFIAERLDNGISKKFFSRTPGSWHVSQGVSTALAAPNVYIPFIQEDISVLLPYPSGHLLDVWNTLRIETTSLLI